MKRAAAILTLLFLSVAVYADERADALLARMSAKLKAMGEYEVVFNVSAGMFKAKGQYTVSGNEYLLTLGDAEVFCDGKTRYEVNNAVAEITIDTVNPSERNILNNPVGGLDFLSEEFSSELIAEGDKSTIIRLTPTKKSENTAIEVTLNNATRLPSRLVYRMAGDAITIDLLSVKPSTADLRRFDASAYKDYEIIDFR